MSDLVRIKRFRNTVEAEIAKSFLEQQGIHAAVSAVDAGGTVSGLAGRLVGEGALYVLGNDVDAIVRAANEALVGGHGVDGAVHRTAGPGLFEECRTIGYCPEGDARITKGYLLPARHVIHTVGPVWEGGQYGEAKLLRSCYIESLKLVEANNVETVAFPCIAAGEPPSPSVISENELRAGMRFLHPGPEGAGFNDALHLIRVTDYLQPLGEGKALTIIGGYGSRHSTGAPAP
jgi:hypothetical protein